MVSMSVSCCCFYSGKIRSPRTNYLSSTPMFSSPSFLNFLSFTLCLRSFWFIPSLFQISPLIKGIEIIFGDPGLLPPTFFSKYLTTCLSHLCIVGGNHGTNVPVIIPQTDKLCEFPIYCSLKSACHIWVPWLLNAKHQSLVGLAFWLSSV